MKQRVRVLALLATLSLAGPVRAQAQQLGAVMQHVAAAWSRNDEKTIAAMIAREGVSLETEMGRLGPLGGRQAAAVLRRLFEERQTRDVRIRQMQGVGGRPPRGYAEFIWTTVAPETTQPVRVVVFVEFVLEQEKHWRISKIRLLP